MEGKVAIITGASSGMGREFALQIAKGYRSIGEFWLIARRGERLEKLRSQLLGKKVKIFSLDLSRKECLEELQATLEYEKPQVKLLVNAAGYGIIGDAYRMEQKDRMGMVDVNCRSLTEVSIMAVPWMVKGGMMLQLASAASFVPQPGFAVYAASKAYVLSFSRALNRELKERDIVVTAVCPGAVDTEFFEIAEQYQKRKWYKQIIMAKPEKVIRRALLDAKHGKSVSVYGIPMKMFRFICKVIPHKLLTKLV